VNTRRIDALLADHQSIGLDTSVVIYAVEANPKYLALVSHVLHWLRTPNRRALTSTITMTEALVRPYRLGDLPLVKEFHALLVTYPNLHWIEPTLKIADVAAQIRAEHNLRTPDAIQAATAIVADASAFISNDPIFRRIKSLDVLILDEMLQ
jgi:predicted nucleic acid-binding protein